MIAKEARYLDNSYLEEAKKRGVDFKLKPQKRVVVLGSEVATPFGDEDKLMEAMYDGRSAIQYLPEGRNQYTNIGGVLPSPEYDSFDELDKDDPRYKKGGELEEFYKRKQAHHRNRNFRAAAIVIDLARSAAKEAGLVDENGKTKEELVHPYRVSSTIASGYGEGHRIIDIWQELHRDGIEQVRKRSRRVDMRDVFAVFPEEINGNNEIDRGAQGWSVSSPEACATGTASIAEGWRLIREGRSDVVFSGAFEDVLHRHGDVTLGMFASSIHALAEGYDLDPAKASRPWDKNRQGFVPSSGAGVMVLAGLDWVREHGLEKYIQAELTGAAKGSDASEKNPLMDPERVADVFAAALYNEDMDAMLEPDAVYAHATGTKKGDELEALGYRKVLGPQMSKTVFTAVKSILGHKMGAAGAVNAILAKNVFRDNLVVPTINCDEPDPEIMKAGDFYIARNKPEPADNIDVIAAPGLGFGGKNAVVVFRRWYGK